MSRTKRLAWSLISGYLLLGANTLYTLASFRLANGYLVKAEFGLWGVMSNIAQYIMLLDIGMTGTSRILIDYKDKKDDGGYGSVILTFLCVGAVQAVLVFLVGLGLAAGLAQLLHIPAELQRKFVLLTIGQSALVAGTFLTRVQFFLLGAHQRYDLANYTAAVCCGLNFGVMWLAFKLGQGVYSTIWSQLAAWLVSATVGFFWVLRLKLVPSRGHWGRPSWRKFVELFNYGRDVFLVAIGFQMLNFSQSLVLTRIVGLEAAAVWNVCTKSYLVVSQVIFRIFEYSGTALAEMMVRGERELLYRRFRAIVILSVSLAVAAGALFTLCNQPFVRLWMGNNYTWRPLNDGLLAISLVLVAGARCHLGLVGQSKQIHSMRYLYVVEGLFFVSLALVTVHFLKRWIDASAGISGMLVASIAGTLLFSLPYGLWRTSRYFQVPWRTVAVGWFLPPLRLALCLAPVTAGVFWLARTMPARVQFVFSAVVGGLAALPLLLRLGLDEGLRAELLGRIPPWLRLP